MLKFSSFFVKNNLLKIPFNNKISRFSNLNESRVIYNIFNLSENFTNKELKNKYLELCKKSHPDVDGGSIIKFLEIQKAYEILSNVDKKKNMMK